MEPEEIQALIDAQRAKGISDSNISAKLRFQGIDATEYLKKKESTEASASASATGEEGVVSPSVGSQGFENANASSGSPLSKDILDGAFEATAHPSFVVETWDPNSREDKEALHITAPYYDAFQKSGVISLAEGIESYETPEIVEIYQGFLSNTDWWGGTVNSTVDDLAKELAKNNDYLTANNIEVETVRVTGGFGSAGGIITTPVPAEEIAANKEKAVRSILSQKVRDNVAATLRDKMPEKMRNSEEALLYMEQFMLEQYGSMIDLSGDGTVGNTPFLQFDGFTIGKGPVANFYTPKFSGYLADKFNAAGVDLINGIYNFFGGESKNVKEAREYAEKLRAETLQFHKGVGESFTDGDFKNGMTQVMGFASEAAPTMAVLLPVATATGGLGLPFWSTTGLIGLEGATLSTIQEAARTRDHDMFKTYTKDGVTIGHYEMLDVTNGDPELMAQYEQGFNDSARFGHLSTVFGTDFVATGASTLFFLKALKGVGATGGGQEMAHWWRSHLANAGYSIPVTGVTGGLAAMTNYVSIMERTGQDYTWEEVRQIGLDVGVSAGLTVGPGGSLIGSAINLASSKASGTVALSRDLVGRNGGNVKIQQQRSQLLKTLRESTDSKETVVAERMLVDLERQSISKSQRDESFYRDMNPEDYNSILEIHREFNRKYAERSSIEDPNSPIAKRLDTEMEALVENRVNIEKIYEVDESTATTPRDGDPSLQEPASDVYQSDANTRMDQPSTLAFDPSYSPWWYREWVDKYSDLTSLQRSIMEARPGGEQGRRVPLAQDLEVLLKLSPSKAAHFVEQAIQARKDAGITSSLLQLNKDLPTSTYKNLPEGFTRDAMGLLDRYMASLYAPVRNQKIVTANLSEIAKLEAKTKPNAKDLSRIEFLRGKIEEAKGSGMTDKTSIDFIESIDPAVRTSLDGIVENVRVIQQDTRDAMLQYGIIDKETHATWTADDTYAPLYGMAASEVGVNIAEGSVSNLLPGKSKGQPSSLKKATGRSDETTGILSKILHDNTLTHVAGQRNIALNGLYELVRNNPNPDVYNISDTAAPGGKSVKVYVNGKEQYVNFENAVYANAFNVMTPAHSDTYVKVIAPISRFAMNLPKMFTSFSPEFWAGNAPRDFQTSIVNAISQSQKQFGYALFNSNGEPINTTALVADMASPGRAEWINTFRTISSDEFGMTGNNHNTEINAYYQEYKSHGGKTGWAYQQPLQNLEASLRAETNPKGRASVASKWMFDNSLGLLESFNNVFESTYRFQVYKALRSQGVEADYAAATSKNVTIDFNRSGSKTHMISAIKYFFNAGVQGVDMTATTAVAIKPKVTPDGESRAGWQRLTGSQKLLMGATMFGSLVTQFNEGASGVDEDGVSFYDKIPDSEKQRNLIIMIPGSETGERIKIPLAYGYGATYNLGVIQQEVSMGQRSVEDGALFTGASIISNFSPVHIGSYDELDASKSTDPLKATGRTIGSIITPDPIKGLQQVAENVDAFGRPIAPEDLPGKARHDQWHTSGVALREVTRLLNDATGSSEVSSGVDINPDMIEHLLHTYGGGPSVFVDKSGGMIMDIRSFANESNENELHPESWPIIRRFYGKDFEESSYGKYYNAKDVTTAYLREFGNVEDLLNNKDKPLPKRDALEGAERGRYDGALAMAKLFRQIETGGKDSKGMAGLAELRKMLVEKQRGLNYHMFSSSKVVSEWTSLESQIEKISDAELKLIERALREYYKFHKKPEE